VTLREDSTEPLPSVTFSFSDTPMSVLPSGTGAPYAVPTGGHHDGSGAPILICHPVDPTLYPGSPNNATMSAIPSDPAPTSALPAPTDSASAPSGKGSGGPVYICYPADSAAPPSGSPPASDAPSFSLPTGTGSLQPMPTGSQGSGDAVYLQCSPADPAATSAGSPGSPNDATPTPISSGPAPTSAPSSSAPDV